MFWAGGYVILACCQKVEMMLSKAAIIFIWFRIHKPRFISIFLAVFIFFSVLDIKTSCMQLLNILKGIPLKSRLKSNHLAYYDDPGKLRRERIFSTVQMMSEERRKKKYMERKKNQIQLTN